MKKGLSEERRAKIRARVLELEAERDALLKTSRAFELACKQLAEERRVDVGVIKNETAHVDDFLCMLRTFVEADNGTLLLSIKFPNSPTIEVSRFDDLDGDDM